MPIDLQAARAFVASNARALDRRRFAALVDPSAVARRAVVDAVGAYRNPDGGYGWGLEPDLRAPESQPAGALHALEAFAGCGAECSSHVASLLDWLSSVSLPGGALPFALPIADASACAPFWVGADSGAPSLQITAAVAAQAHRVARAVPEVRDHPWLVGATRYCFDAVDVIDGEPFAYVLSFALQLLDAASDVEPSAPELLARVARFVPDDGRVAVAGGSDGEELHLLDYAWDAKGPVQGLFGEDAVQRDLDRLEAAQLADGGWAVDFANYSPAAALEWRGHATVRAIATLRTNGR